MARLGRDDEHMTELGAGAPGDVFFRMGVMYAAGRSVPLDRITAHAYLSVAAAKGVPAAAQYRKELSCEMSREDVLEAQRRAREWLALH
jgi:uncharacterized protein